MKKNQTVLSIVLQSNINYDITGRKPYKRYRSRTVVNGVSISLRGEIVGLLGPNGAGKTTTFYMIVGMIKANDGRIFLTTGISPVCRCMSGPETGSVIWLRRLRCSVG
jgi:ABC-type uncharacterized transport system ATPase subunit